MRQRPSQRTIILSLYKSSVAGFHGKNNMDMAKVDYVSDCFYDIMDDYMRMYHDRDGRIMVSVELEKAYSCILNFTSNEELQ